eukprot:18734-Heterococcus_DN1.PRE.1
MTRAAVAAAAAAAVALPNTCLTTAVTVATRSRYHHLAQRSSYQQQLVLLLYVSFVDSADSSVCTRRLESVRWPSQSESASVQQQEANEALSQAFQGNPATGTRASSALQARASAAPSKTKQCTLIEIDDPEADAWRCAVCCINLVLHTAVAHV